MEEEKKARDVNKRTKQNQKIAQELANKITVLSNQAIEKEKIISVKLTSITQQLDKSSEAQTQIEEIRTTIKNSYVQYNEQKNQIIALIQEIQNFQNNQFKPLQQQFVDEQNGVGTIINEAKEKRNALTNLDSQANQLYIKLNDSVQLYQAKLEALSSIETAINQLYDKVQNPETGIEKKLEQIQTTKGQIDELGTQIKESHRISTDLTNEIKNLHETVQENLKSVQNAEQKSLDIQKKIDDIYKSVVPKMKGGWFDKTRKSFAKQQYIWLVILMGSIAATTYVAFNIYSKFGDNGSTFINIFLRYATVSPLIFFIVFCARQYRLARVSYEKYTFKTVLSISLPADIEILRDKFEINNTKEPEIMKFALDKLYSLYDEPYFDEAMQMKYKIEQDQIRFGTNAVQDDIDEESSDFEEPVENEKQT